nr:MAG TPA: hypothetical protein [Caudoviricetes sp.]
MSSGSEKRSHAVKQLSFVVKSQHHHQTETA